MGTLGTMPEGLDVSTIKLKYIKSYEDRTGKMRHYFNKRGCDRTPLPGLPGSREFMAAYQQCLDTMPTPAERPKASRVEKGSMSDLIVRYYNSASFRNLAPLTQSSYRNEIRKIDEAHGAKPVAMLDRKGIKLLIAKKAETPGAANKLLRTLKMLMKFAIDEEMRADDPTAGVKPLKVPGDGFLPWLDEHLEMFEARHPIGSKARLAYALCLYTAQRRSDVVRMGRQHIRGNLIAVRQQKTGTYLEVPIHPELASIIDAIPRENMTLLLNENGTPFKPASFGNWFGDRCREAGLGKGYNAHGLRKAGARRLAEAGCTAHEIMSITGHQSIGEVERYTRAANRTQMAQDGMAKLTRRSN
jgi:integrase